MTTVVDHVSGNDMEASLTVSKLVFLILSAWTNESIIDIFSVIKAPPKFEMVEYTPVDYEALEFEGE